MVRVVKIKFLSLSESIYFRWLGDLDADFR